MAASTLRRDETLFPAGSEALSRFAGAVEWFGNLGLFVWRAFRCMILPPYEVSEFLRQLDSIGSKSAGLVSLAGAATGFVISMQTRDSLTRFGAVSMLPAVIVFSLLKETGPIITALART
jgi:phospholipid/cholesterol/gamma-HCH transport system permease protein